MFSAISVASTSGLRISTMFSATSPLVILARSPRSFSMSAPFLPITTPGRAVWIVTRARLAGRSMMIFATPRLGEPLAQHLADVDVLMEHLGILAALGVPARIPGPVDTEPQADRVDLLTHYLSSASARSRTTIVR
jgi:hypothetical protein